VVYFDKSVPNSMDLSKPWTKVDVADIVIGPNNSAVLAAVGMSPEDAGKALKKEGPILQWGYAEYADIFEPEKTHTIHFCYLMQPRSTSNEPATGFQPVPYQNDCNRND
jgi:hypothetical protein